MRRGLVGLLTAEVISLVGSRMSLVALPWFVLVITRSAARTGLVAFAEMLPYVLACALGGPLLDRIGARRASIIADAASLCAVAAIPLLHRGPGLGFAALVALVAVAGLLRGFGDTAKRVVFPQTVAAAGMQLTRATSLHDGLSRLAMLLGAPLAGVLIAALDAPAVLLLDAATFGLGALIVAIAVPADLPAADASDGGRGDREPYLAALGAGWRFVRNDALLRAILLMLFATNLFDAAYGSVLAPVWANEVVGSPVALGLLSASFAVGAVLGNVVFTALAPRAPRFALFAVGFLVAGAPRFVAVAVADQLWIVYAVSFVAGVAIAAVNPILGAVSYERIPESLRARVLGLNIAVAWAGIPLGGLLGGWLVEWVGLAAALLGFGALYLLATLLPFLRPAWRELDARPTPQPAPKLAPDRLSG